MNWIEFGKNEKLMILEEIRIRTGFPLFIIGKDWWMVQTLRLVSWMNIAEQIVFNSSTSLSKPWELNNRFNEDIDLTIQC